MQVPIVRMDAVRCLRVMVSSYSACRSLALSLWRAIVWSRPISALPPTSAGGDNQPQLRKHVPATSSHRTSTNNTASATAAAAAAAMEEDRCRGGALWVAYVNLPSVAAAFDTATAASKEDMQRDASRDARRKHLSVVPHDKQVLAIYHTDDDFLRVLALLSAEVACASSSSAVDAALSSSSSSSSSSPSSSSHSPSFSTSPLSPQQQQQQHKSGPPAMKTAAETEQLWMTSSQDVLVAMEAWLNVY